MSQTTDATQDAQSLAAQDFLIKQEALQWYVKKYPKRQLAEEKIVTMYLSIKKYAGTDPLLKEYYRANRILV